jgi:predicted enzyme related to lactoylglutathione lyase
MISGMANSVAKWQILSTDPDQTAKFYASLFGWRIDAKNAMGYRELKTSNGVDGGVWPAPPEAHDFVQLFIEVDDIDAAIAKATSLGGSVIVPKSALPDGDTMAIIADPHGLSFGLMAKRA